MTGDPMSGVHAAWLPEAATASVGRRSVALVGDGPVVDTLRDELTAAVSAHGGALVGEPDAEVVFRIADGEGREGFTVAADGGSVVVEAETGRGLADGYFHLLRAGDVAGEFRPAFDLRVLDHWDNIQPHPVMGPVERGYAGASIFYLDGEVRDDLTRVDAYARLLASIGINRVAINNVNVHAREALFITDLLPDVARVAECFRRWGIRTHLSVNFFAPMIVGGLPTADPTDAEVQMWWRDVVDGIYAAIPDFGGFVVKADSEGQPGPIAYGRTHADGANTLARALAPHGGVLHWRAFVYNHLQDWRDRKTDRARAAHDHFTPLDGQFDDNVIVQVKHGPLDFQVREAVSPLFGAMPKTRLALELQVTQEYTGQQKHVCYLGPWWSEILGFPIDGPDSTVHGVVRGGIVAVSNVGTNSFWTGHPLAQANLYAYGRLAWDPTLDATAVLREWAELTFAGAPDAARAAVEIAERSWQTYEKYTAPLGVCFMVEPGHHYGPSVDGYEYSKWGTYHFADRDGLGVDRTRATGTGFTGQYQAPWRDTYESIETCPDDLLLFFHHVGYDHVLHNGTTVIQHIYDTHFEGVDDVERMRAQWADAAPAFANDQVFHGRVTELLDEQVRSATDWRDQINTYFLRKSGVADAHGRTIF